MRVFYSSAYCETDVAFDTTRKARALAQSLLDHPIAGVELSTPPPATRDDLLTAHDVGYVDAVLTGEPRSLALTNELGGWDAGLARAVLASTGGVREAALWSLQHRTVAGSLSSGLHHARRDSGYGYCTVNGLVIAARAAVAAGARRVLILDLDAHCGGGTASLIGPGSVSAAGIEQVDVSVDPFDTYTSTSNARLVMTDGEHYLDVIESELGRIDDPGSIDLVLYNAGMDPHEHAEGGVPGITAATLARREATVFDWCAGHRLAVAWVLAGGYTTNMTMADLVGLHRLTIEAAVPQT
jgi:acetoin utilization deacetylase AcuC-like enzyme